MATGYPKLRPFGIPRRAVRHTAHLVGNDRAEPPERRYRGVAGTYLAACVLYAAIFRRSPEALGYLGGLPKQDALDLQAEAASSALENPDQWGLG